jgi:hypothetical protein
MEVDENAWLERRKYREQLVADIAAGLQHMRGIDEEEIGVAEPLEDGQVRLLHAGGV